MQTRAGSFVQILVSTVVKLASAYDHIYWDFP